MSLRLLLFALLLAPAAQAQIYRCETPRGVEFSDAPCGEQAKIVTIEDESSGIDPGPSDDVRDYLEEKKEERAEERVAAREARREAELAARRAAPPVVYVDRPGYPAWWGLYNRPTYRPPGHRPPNKPPMRPQPQPRPPDSFDPNWRR